MTKETLAKAQELNSHIHCRKEELKDIKHYEDLYSGYPIRLGLKRTSDDSVCSNIDIFDRTLKKEILNLLKIHLIADIQKREKELEQL